jgi:hypothetical protein
VNSTDIRCGGNKISFQSVRILESYIATHHAADSAPLSKYFMARAFAESSALSECSLYVMDVSGNRDTPLKI